MPNLQIAENLSSRPTQMINEDETVPMTIHTKSHLQTLLFLSVQPEPSEPPFGKSHPTGAEINRTCHAEISPEAAHYAVLTRLSRTLNSHVYTCIYSHNIFGT